MHLLSQWPDTCLLFTQRGAITAQSILISFTTHFIKTSTSTHNTKSVAYTQLHSPQRKNNSGQQLPVLFTSWYRHHGWTWIYTTSPNSLYKANKQAPHYFLLNTAVRNQRTRGNYLESTRWLRMPSLSIRHLIGDLEKVACAATLHQNSGVCGSFFNKRRGEENEKPRACRALMLLTKPAHAKTCSPHTHTGTVLWETHIPRGVLYGE